MNKALKKTKIADMTARMRELRRRGDVVLARQIARAIEEAKANW